MALTVVHPFVNNVPDSGDTDLVQPSNWNAPHTVSGTLPSSQVSGTIPSSQVIGSSLTVVNDTNVSLALSGDSSIALVNSVTITAGWIGTLSSDRLNANVVQSASNDTNVTGTISSQQLTLGWAGTLSSARLNANVVQSASNDTNVTGTISSQQLTLGWTGTLAPSRGGLGIGSYTVGDMIYATSASSLSKLAATAVGKVIISNGVATAPSWSANVVLNTAANSTESALNINQTIAGVSTEALSALNRYFATDVLDAGAGNGVNWVDIYGGFGGSPFSGNRAGFAVTMGMNGPSGNAGTGSYICLSGAMTANSCDGGTSPDWPNNAGAFWGGYFLGATTSAAQNLRAVFGVECDIANQSTSVEMICNMLYLRPTTNLKQAKTYDCLEAWQSQAGSAKAKYGMLIFGNAAFPPTGNEFPISSDGYVLSATGSSTGTVGYGIDLSNIGTITNYAFLSPGFGIDGTGTIKFSSVAALYRSGAFTTLTGKSSAFSGVSVGDGTDPRNFYDNDSHYYRDGALSGHADVVINGVQTILATNSTHGFLYIPTSTGTPTGTPNSYTGNAPIVFDSGNNRLWVNSTSGWRWATTSSS